MKTRIFTLGALAVAAAALFSCSKEVELIQETSNVGETAGIPFEILVSSVDTKTVNSAYSTTWSATDKINLFHAEAGGTSYVNDGQFSASGAGSSVSFSGTLGGELTAANYDWYAIYPYTATNVTPANTSATGYVTIGSAYNDYQTQTGNDSKAHLAGPKCPLIGKVTSVAKETQPSISMSQLTSVVAVEVTNGTSQAIVVKDVSFTGTEPIVGDFSVKFTSSPVVFTPRSAGYVSNVANLHVESGSSIAAGSKATFFIAIKPFTASAGSKITMMVDANNGRQSVTSSELGADFSFQAGQIHKVSFTYNKAVVSTASEAFTTGFETSDGFTATTSYNNTVVKYQGLPNQWGIVSGSAISSSAKINGSQSMLMRDYSANGFAPYVFTSFKFSSVKEVRFYAKNTSADYKIKLSYSTDFENWTDANTFELTTSAVEYKHVFATAQTNIALKFTVVLPDTRVNKTDVIIDDVCVSATAFLPTIGVTTTAATDVATAAGTTATLNGSISLLYDAVIGDLDEAGFYYKTTAAGSYTKVTCSPKPAAAGAYSYALTGLTAGTEYIYYAYGVYDGGDEITGETQTFTTVSANKVVYTVTSTSAVSTSGAAPAGSSATYSSTYNTKFQLTSGNSMTLTLSGFDGKRITGLTLSMKSNKSGGSGWMYMGAKAGSTLTKFATIATEDSPLAFNNAAWNGSYSTSYVDVDVDVTPKTIGAGENIEIYIKATANSLYCESFSLTYE